MASDSFAEGTSTERVPLVFAEIEPTPAGKRFPASLSAYAFLDIVRNAPLEAQTEDLLTEVFPQLRRRQDAPAGLAESRWLERHIDGVAALLEPGETSTWGPLVQQWRRDLTNNPDLESLFTPAIMAAVTEAPPVLVCRYDQGPALPADLQTHMWSLGRGKLKSVSLAFWTGPVPDAITPETLRTFRGPDRHMHPLIVIGPPIEACPDKLGTALEIMAAQFPGQVPAAKAVMDGAAEAAGADDSREPSETTIARLAGISVAITNTGPWGMTSDYEHLMVDRLDPDGPAARAGFRSGDYLSMVGWSHHETIESLASALLAAEERKAAVLSRHTAGSDDHQAALVVFADALPEAMVELPRDIAVQGRTVLVDRGWQMLSVASGDWCAPHVEVVDALDVGADEVVPISASAGLGESFARIRADCPLAETVSVLRVSSRLGAPIHILSGALNANRPLARAGIDGMPFGETVAHTRAIALAEAPACDRLAAHPRDPMRRYGLEGVISFAEDDLEQAFQACLAANDADPDDVVVQYQLGRVLHAGGLREDALALLRTAAEGGHGGANDLLGEMHLLGEGVSPDPAAASDFFEAAWEAGFRPPPVPDPAVIDLTDVTLPQAVREVFELGARMYTAMDPEYETLGLRVSSAYLYPEDRDYLVRMAVEVATLCGAAPSIEALRSARVSGLENGRDIDHALHLYGEVLPSLRRRILEQYPTASYPNEGSQASVSALVALYDCLAPQLRQFTINAFDMALEGSGGPKR